MKQLRWGILGTGNIARQFCAGVRESSRGHLQRVASRDASKAAEFARLNHIPFHEGSYEQLLASNDVDAIYVSLPNHLHHEWTIRALRAGKHVLCEKPIAVSHAQALEMVSEARRLNLTLVEAFMYRSHPQTHALLDAVRSGIIGDLRHIRTSFCFRVRNWRDNIRFQPSMGGGALMDVGCYCVNLSRLVAGAEPTEIRATGNLHESGVDDLATGYLRFPSSVLASFTCGMSLQADNTAYVCGSEGYIAVPVPWKPPVSGGSFTIHRMTPPKMEGNANPVAPPPQTITTPAGKDLYAYEADDFAATVLDGKPPAVTLEDSLANMSVVENLRQQVWNTQ